MTPITPSGRGTSPMLPAGMAEEWRFIPGFSRYEASNFGEIRPTWSSTRPDCVGRPLKQRLSQTGYLLVDLTSDSGAIKTVRAHRAVALAFLGHPPPGKTDVAHFDGSRTNNVLSNLRWASRSENCADAIRHGTWPGRGAPQVQQKLSDEDVATIRRLYVPGAITQREIGEAFGVTAALVSLIIRGIHRPADRWKAASPNHAAHRSTLLARGPATHDHGQSARGADFLPGSPRCTPRSARLCQEAPDQVVHDVADSLPRPVGVEVVISVCEARQFHAPSIRMEMDQCLVIRATEIFGGKPA